MKPLSILFFVVLFTNLACKNETKSNSDVNPDGTQSTSVTTQPGASLPPAPNTANAIGENAQPQMTPPPAQAEPAQNAKGVWHFTCPKGCKGGGGAAGPCPKCGAALAHNQAYHEGTNTTPAPATAANSNPQITVPTTQGAKVEPPQNAKGVWHFTCPKGCSGGGGAAGPCGKCGATLAHNQAYHQ